MKELPKICMVTCLFELVDSQSLLFAKTILSWGYSLIAICPGKIPDSLSAYEIQHYHIPLPTHNFDFNSSLLNILGGLFQRARNSVLALAYLLRAKPEICVCIQPDSWLLSIIGKLFLHNRVVVDLREIYEDRASAFPVIFQPLVRRSVRFLFKFLSRYTDEIIHVSKARQGHYSYLSKPGVVISPFPQLEFYSNPCSVSKQKEVTVVHAGSLRWTYASEQFIESIPMVLEHAPNVKFVVIGGITSKLNNMQLVERLIASKKLILMPRISHEKVVEILCQSDIGISLVLPLDQTHILAMPRKFFEYIAAGLPVVTADVPTLRDIVETNPCGVLVDPCSPQSIADGILRLVTSEKLRKELGDSGRVSCENYYNWRIESIKLQDLLTSLEPSRQFSWQRGNDLPHP